MSSQKVLSNKQVNWYEEESTRLNYQMIFNEIEKEEEKEKKENYGDARELTEMLDERDNRWKNKLKLTRESAHEEGYQKGYEEGLAQARTEIDQKLKNIQEMLAMGQQHWKENQQLIEPGLLDLSFEIAENILGIPVENPEIRQGLEQKLAVLLQKTDEATKPLLKVCEEDFEYIEELVDKYSDQCLVTVRVAPHLNPGEFEMESSSETVVHVFREMLDDFKKNLTVPSWK